MAIRVLFFGTPNFAYEILSELNQSENIELVGLVTAPDKPVGRKQILTPSPVKTYGTQYNIPIYTPHRVNSTEFLETLAHIPCDIAIVAAYGAILSSKLLDTLNRRIINVHPSLLPKYRGPAPIQHMLLNGEETTGVTLIEMDEKMDHGPILAQASRPLPPNELFIDLEYWLAKLSAQMLEQDIPAYHTDDLKPTPQNHEEATFTSFIRKQDGRIDWNVSATDIYNQYRALHSWPGVFTFMPTNSGDEFQKVELSDLKLHNINSKLPAGTLSSQNETLYVGTGHGVIEVGLLKPAGKQWMAPKTFANGYKIENFI